MGANFIFQGEKSKKYNLKKTTKKRLKLENWNREEEKYQNILVIWCVQTSSEEKKTNLSLFWKIYNQPIIKRQEAHQNIHEVSVSIIELILLIEWLSSFNTAFN